MNNRLYTKLAADNIKRNAQTYVPYIITCIITSAMLYIIRSLSLNTGLDSMSGGYALKDILKFGSHVTKLFAFIFLFYTNSFLIKRRKREFGLFNILGMEKRHIAKVLFLESLYTAVLSLLAGILTGILLDKLLFLVITKMLGGSIQLGFYISKDSISTTCIFMLVTFLLIYMNALRQIHLANPVDLLHGSEMGEREPKTKWLMAILGLVFIGAGYYISIVTTQPLQALPLFFVAVVCVIIGTYLLFMAGSIAVLKMLKSNKRYYYKISHFTTVSGMIYRMKQNAVGLANICILSTMVLVMISTTSCFLAGMEDIINSRYPYEFMVSSTDGTMQDTVRKYLMDEKIGIKESEAYTDLTFEVMQDGDMFYIPETYSFDMDGLCELVVLKREDYNRLTNRDVTLQDDSILFYSDDEKMNPKQFMISDKTYSVAQRLEEFPIATSGVVKAVCIVVKDKTDIQKLYKMQKAAYGKNASMVQNHFDFDIVSGEEEEVYNALSGFVSDNIKNCRVEAKYEAHENCMSLYGGLFFLGVFLGTLFLMQTILIIYYKQVSEGYDDKKRFAIMQNVGMSKAEVKKSIHSQIITVFFLPLITAGVHIGFSFPLISRMLLMFRMDNTKLFIICLIICFVAFAVIYALIYSVTAKTYYKIVKR